MVRQAARPIGGGWRWNFRRANQVRHRSGEGSYSPEVKPGGTENALNVRLVRRAALVTVGMVLAGILSACLVITTEVLPTMYTNTPVSFPMAGSSENPPLQWSAAGLPSGLTIKKATGVISGTPTTAGTYSVTVAVTDAKGRVQSKAYSLKVEATGARLLAVNGNHSCAILTKGTVRCWGYNSNGQLGNGDRVDYSVPVSVVGLTNPTSIGLGFDHTCALKSGGVLCWGDNYAGELGNGTFTDSLTPVPVSGISGATELGVGYNHACVILGGGTAKCWGGNLSRQLGSGSTVASSTTPVTVSGLTGASKIATGVNHTCVIVGGGAVKCWGANASGQLGNGSTTDSAVPVSVVGISDAVGLATGSAFTCANLSGGTVKCWGRNGSYELGTGTAKSSLVPITVSGLTGAIEIAAGKAHACARTNSGTVRCWGLNSFGAIGDGTTNSAPLPVTITGASGATALNLGQNHTCALMGGGSVKCWGWNSYGQVGNATFVNARTPVSVYGLVL